MAEPIEALERHIEQLRAAVRQAVLGNDRARARTLRAELRQAEGDWDEALADLAEQAQQAQPASPPRDENTAEASPPLPDPPGAVPASVPRQGGPLLPIREQVHHALTLLGVPAAPKLIIAVHEACFAGQIVGARLTSLRRDEERSFRAAPYARPYYLCCALIADLLAPARGLLAVSTWPMPQRIVGPLSPRVDFLTAAIRIAEHLGRLEPSPAALRLLWRFATNIPGATPNSDASILCAHVIAPDAVADAARAELAVHEDTDRSQRHAAADRARTQLDEAEQLFGSRLRLAATDRTETA